MERGAVAATSHDSVSDQIFLLSRDEAGNISYFPTDESRKVSNTAYAAGRKNDTTSSVGPFAGSWWLRSPGNTDDSRAGVVSSDGRLGSGIGAEVNIDSYGVRPAFNLASSAVLFTSAASGGKDDAEVDSALTAVGWATGEWKLTLLDTSRNGFRASTTTTSAAVGDTVAISFSGARTGSNEYVSAMLVNSSSVLYYGRIAQGQYSGSASVTIPSPLPSGTYTLKVFSEQYNGDYKTDYASVFVEIPLTVTGDDDTAPILSSVSADRNSDATAAVTFTSSEAGRYYYAVVESGAAQPNIDTSGLGTPCEAGTNTINLTGLSGKTAKDIYIVAKDAAGNVSQKLKIGIPEAPTYDYRLSSTSLYFGTWDLSQARPSPQTVIITNTGNQALQVVLPSGAGLDYEITPGTGFDASGTAVSLAPKGTAQFTVQPKEGLKLGQHLDSISISIQDAGRQGIFNRTVNFQLNMTVTCTTHDYGGWTTTYSTHTRVCTHCGAEGEPAEHTYDEGGTACNVCGKERTDISNLSVLAEAYALPFNGQEQEIVIKGVRVYLSDTDTEPVELTYTLSGQTSGTNIGTYMITINGTGHFTGTKEFAWFIVKAAAPTVPEQAQTYWKGLTEGSFDLGGLDGLLPEDRGETSYSVSGVTGCAASATIEGGTLTYQLASGSGTSGAIHLKAEMENYEDASITIRITLTDAAPVKITGVTAQDGVYNGQPHLGYIGTPTAEGYDGGFTVTYSGREGTSYSSTDAPTDAGHYTVTIAVPEGLSYAGSVPIQFEIARADLSDAAVTLAPPESGYTYDGAAKTPGVTVKKNGAAVASGEYSVAYSNSNGGAGDHTSAGTVTVTVTAAASGNYTGSAEAKFEIGRAALTPSLAGTATKVYDGTDAAPAGLSISLEGVVGGDAVTASASLAYNSPNVTEADTITATGITLSGADAGNYQLSSTTAQISGTITRDDSASAPAAGEGYTVSYPAETIAVKDGYEVSTAQDGGTAIPTGGSISDCLGQTLYIRKTADSNHSASGWTAFTLAARPAAPSLTQTGETLKGQKNGALSGLTTGMEYSADGGASWTACAGTSLTGLAGSATILVRLRATEAKPCGDAGSYTIAEGAGITVTFDPNGREAAGMPEALTDQSYGSAMKEPAAPASADTDYAFDGWYKDRAGTEAWDFASDTLTAGSVTLYARWKQVYFSVTAEVTDDSGNPYGSATVKLMRGSEVIDTITGGSGGRYTFAKHVEAGMYNVVVSYTDADGTHTKTALIEVSGDSTTPVSLPPAGVNSHLEVSGDPDTPAVMVGGLDEEAKQRKAENSGASRVVVSMAVEGRQEPEVAAPVAEAIKAAVGPASGEGAPIVEYLDVTLTAQIGSGPARQLDAARQVLELVIPFDFSGRSDIAVVRYRGSAAEKLMLGSDNSKADGTYRLDRENGYIHIYAQKFSTYAVAYTTTNTYTITLNANGGTVGSAALTTGADGLLASLPTPTRDGYTFDGWYTAERGGTQVTASTRFKADATIYAHWTPAYSGGAGGSSTYAVSVEDPAHGTVKTDHAWASSGTTVTIIITPDRGYALDRLTVTDSRGNELPLTDRGGGKYTFTMPGGKVAVEALFTATETGHDCPSLGFADLSATAWYHEAVDYVLENGMMSGYGNGIFGPSNALSRAQLCQILYNLEGSPAVTGSSIFADVADTAWYAGAVAWANTSGIAGGYGGGLFGPNDPVTREQLAAILYRYAQYKGHDVAQGGMAIREFSDCGSISAYAVEAMTWAVDTGVVGGYEDKALRPRDGATRAQAAQMLMNFLAEF